MPLDLSPLRMQNWFGPSRDNMWDVYGGQQPNSYGDLFQPRPFAPRGMYNPVEDDIVTLMKQLYIPETEASDRYNQMLNNFPQRNNPGILRKIAATMMGLSDRPDRIQQQEHALYAPYMRNLTDWQAQEGPAYKAANLERQSNINERQMAYNTANAELGQRRIVAANERDAARQAEFDRRQTETERANLAKEEISRSRMEIYRIKSTMPNMKFDFSGPTVLAADPRTGRTIDTGVKTGHLTEYDKMYLQQDFTLAAIAARGDEARATKETVPGASPTNSAANEMKRQYLTARQLAMSDPSLAPFIHLDDPTPGYFRIDLPAEIGGRGSLWGSPKPTMQQHQKIRDAIYGSKIPEGTSISSMMSGAQSQEERVTVVDPQGKVGTIPKSQLEAALSMGYKVQ